MIFRLVHINLYMAADTGCLVEDTTYLTDAVVSLTSKFCDLVTEITTDNRYNYRSGNLTVKT